MGGKYAKRIITDWEIWWRMGSIRIVWESLIQYGNTKPEWWQHFPFEYQISADKILFKFAVKTMFGTDNIPLSMSMSMSMSTVDLYSASPRPPLMHYKRRGSAQGCAFSGLKDKNLTFTPRNSRKKHFWARFWRDLENRCTMGVLQCKLPLIVVVAP